MAKNAVGISQEKKPAAEQYEFVYGFFRKDCFERNEFFNYEHHCFQHFATKIFGYSVILACLIFKVPQMLKIVNDGSAEGLSSFGAVTELLHYL